MLSDHSIFVGVQGPQQSAVREKVTSMVVNAHGGLVRMRTRVYRGQKLIVTNTRRLQTATSRVVSVRPVSDDQNLVAFEFDRPTASIWPVIGLPPSWKSMERPRSRAAQKARSRAKKK